MQTAPIYKPIVITDSLFKALLDPDTPRRLEWIEEILLNPTPEDIAYDVESRKLWRTHWESTRPNH